MVATETGIIHRLKREVPEKEFEAAHEAAVCRFMKMITLEKVRDSLRDLKYEVTVEPGIARARPRRDRPHGRDRLSERSCDGMMAAVGLRAQSAVKSPALMPLTGLAASRGASWSRSRVVIAGSSH